MRNAWRNRFLPRRLKRRLRYRAAIGARATSPTWSDPPEGPVLVLAPHSDDEIIGAGGTAALHAKRGDKIEAAIVYDGRLGGEEGVDPDALVETRESESREAAARIGFRDIHFARSPESASTVREQDLRWLGALLEALRPRTIYLPSPIDCHPDHAMTNELLARTLKEGGGWTPTEVAAYEVWSPLIPNRLIDISGTIEIKRRALASFRSQTRRSNIDGAALGLAAYRGARHGRCAAAEAFWVSPPERFIEVWSSVKWP